MMSKNSIVPFLKDYLIKFLTRPFLLDTNVDKINTLFSIRANKPYKLETIFYFGGE